MKQPKMKVTDTDTKEKDWGYKKVMSIDWDYNGRLWAITIDFMGSGNSIDYITFYNYTGEFINAYGNLKGEIMFD